MLARRNSDLRSQAGTPLRSTPERSCLGSSVPSGDVPHLAAVDNLTLNPADGVAKYVGPYARFEQPNRWKGGDPSACLESRDAPTPGNYPLAGIALTVL